MSMPKPWEPVSHPRCSCIRTPPPPIVITPAAGGAGGQLQDREREDRCVTTTELLAGLGSTLKMYKRLLSLGIGTGGDQAEARKIIWERLSGPTGHFLLLKEQAERNQSETEIELGREGVREETRCWRDVVLVQKLLRIRIKEV